MKYLVPYEKCMGYFGARHEVLFDKYDQMWSYMVMTKVKIAEFKAHLSSYLSRVRKGEEVVITDRQNPIARISPYSQPQEKLVIIPAKVSPKVFKKIKIPPPPEPTDSLKILLEEREDDLEKL